MSEIREYAKKQMTSALHLLEEYNAASNAEVLHQLRVSLKKVKAVLDFLRTLHPKKIKPLRKKLQLIFHAAGSLRETQLRLNWLKEKKYQLLIQHTSLGGKVKEEEELFIIQKQDHLKKLRFVSNELDRLLKGINEKDLIRYAAALKKKFEEHSAAVATDDWHALRKLIKQLLYAHHWLTEQDKLKILTVEAYKKTDELQEKIGVWHDALDLLQWLTDEQFFLSKDKPVKQQFNKAFTLVQKDIVVKEKAALKQLQTIEKPANKK